MPDIRVGLPRVPSRESPELAVADVLAAGFTACEIDLAGGFWLDKEFAAGLGAAATDQGVTLTVHAPIPAFLGHVDRGAKLKRALGMLDHSAGLAILAGARLVVVHPGFLLERDRDEAIDSVVEQFTQLRERLLGKGRDVPFGIEMMGRVRDLGSAADVFEMAQRLDWVEPVIDFAHLHAVSDGAFVEAEQFATILAQADELLSPATPFHIHFSDIAFANRNETKHLPYGEGTLRAEPLREALATFKRPALVISESPDLESHRAIQGLLEPTTPEPAR